MATKTETKVVNEVEIKAAVHTWAKAETSAIWSLIHTIRKGLIGFPDKSKRLFALRTWVNQAGAAEWGDEAWKDKSAHISKIFTIAENASPAHYTRWEKEGTGFYKAYSEFSVPQRQKKTGGAGTGAATNGGATTSTGGTGKAGGVDDEPNKQQLAATAKAAADAGKATPGYQPAPGTGAQAAGVDIDPTVGWAARIDADRESWKKLVGHLTEKKDTILTPEMVLQLLKAAGRRTLLFNNTIAALLQDSFIKVKVVEFITENILMFDGLSADVKPVSVKEPELEPAKA